ncbi:hypothetical protein ONS95_002939 [Cadophora gregata]|uniref:uncharacterized protein n=1 Tax=Cadophora gregata TaxID=51156 RepID=UPI0026DA9231|nr:uncharacterized protein ONS95_002939 [Cadophora gregata]KAK0108116.1 hypothetical protein ONS95_002939 [Cadophora gregata]
MSDSSLVYGCAESYLSSLADQHCASLSSKIPNCGFTDAACCSTAYNFMAEQASCLSPYAACMDFTSWTNDASSGLSACTIALSSGTLTDAAAVPTTDSQASTAKGSSPTITPGPTATGSNAAVTGQSTTTKNDCGRVGVSVYKVGLIGLLGLFVFL